MCRRSLADPETRVKEQGSGNNHEEHLCNWNATILLRMYLYFVMSTLHIFNSNYVCNDFVGNRLEVLYLEIHQKLLEGNQNTCPCKGGWNTYKHIPYANVSFDGHHQLRLQWKLIKWPFLQ